MENTDKRIVKTKMAIREALIVILAQKPIDKITVKELSEQAGINRKTFYAHYECIDDIINELIEEISSDVKVFLENCMINEYGLAPQYFMQFINFLYSSNSDFFENLISSKNYHFMVNRFREILKEQLVSGMDIPEEQKFFAACQVEFILGGVSSAYIEWIKAGKPEPFEELSSMLIAMVMDGLTGINIFKKQYLQINEAVDVMTPIN